MTATSTDCLLPRAQSRVPRWLASLTACAVVASAHAQLGLASLDSSTWPLSTPGLADAIEFAGLRVAPEVVWRCHGDYLERIHALEDEARNALDGLGLDGVRLERPESLRKGITILRRAIARRDEALAELMRCIGGAVPESERTKVDQLGAELRARAALALGVTYGPPHDLGDRFYVFDVTVFLGEMEITPEERDAVQAAVLAASATRERTGRAMFESGLANRMRMAEKAVEFGVAGMTTDEMFTVLQEMNRRRNAEMQAAWARGERPPQPSDPWSEIFVFRSCSREAACEALQAQCAVIDAVTAVISPESGKRLRRAFRHRNLGLDTFIDSQHWDRSQPATPAVIWTARRVLVLPDVRGERRAEAVKILAEWADAEDAIKERMAREKLERLCSGEPVPESHAPRGSLSFYPGAPAIPEFVESARPFQHRLAKLVDMPWIADASLKPPALPPSEALPDFTRTETALTGSLHGAAAPSTRRVFEARKRGISGWRPIDAEDVDEWMTILGKDGSTREVIDVLVAAHRAAWDERVAPLMEVAQEPRPRGQRVEVAGGYTLSEPVGVPEWRERVRSATEASLQSAAEVDAALFADLRAAVEPECAWCADAIVFHRRADQALARHRSVASIGLDDYFFGRSRVHPMVAILRAGLPPEQTRVAIRGSVASLSSLAAVLEEESQLLTRARLSELQGDPPASSEEMDEKTKASVHRMLALETSWRALELGALDEAMRPLDAADRVRIERAARHMRFAHAFDPIDTVSRVSLDLRRAAAEHHDLERGLREIEAIDAAESSFTERVERWVAPRIEKMQRPVPATIDSVEAVRIARNEVAELFSTVGLISRGESARFAWYMVNALSPESVRRSPALLRMAALHEVTPLARTRAGDAP